MNDYINKAIKRYSALFTLPSHRKLLILLLAACLAAGFLLSVPLQLQLPFGLASGLALGIVLFTLTILFDELIQVSSLRADPVFNLRRCSALSLYSLILWLGFIVFGILVDVIYNGVWIKFFLIGFCAALVLRLLVFSAVSVAQAWKVVAFAFLQPVLYTIPVFSMASAFNAVRLDAPFVTLFFLSVTVVLTATFVYIFSINRVGIQILGVGSFSVLKAFMATWTEDQNAPFERLFERFSQKSNIQLSALSFRSVKETIKAVLIVPTFHPGPFKNLGSSDLPYAIQNALEKKWGNCVVMVPHGLSGHDHDLATHDQNQIVLEKALSMSDISDFGAQATPFVRVKRGSATVGCQVFNGCAFVTLTLAPETMEDLPPELDSFIVEAANKNKLSNAVAVDAHNSIQGPFKVDEAVKPLQEAVMASLEKASRHKSRRFQVGAAKVMPKEFDLREGVGQGGITALVVRVEDQTTAYITIDGNNMVSGLRERILDSLSELGVDGGEVFTTDTHVVNAVVLDARGYHPVGEVIDHERLINYVKQAAQAALANMEEAEVAWRTETVSGVKVIGEKQIEAMCLLLDKAVRRAKKLAVTVFPLAGVVLAALLLLL